MVSPCLSMAFYLYSFLAMPRLAAYDLGQNWANGYFQAKTEWNVAR